MKAPFKPIKMSGREILDLLIEFTYLAVIFLVPLWFANLFPTYNIFELNKAVVFQILVWILFLLTFIKLVLYPVGLPLSTRLFFKKYWLVPTIFIIGLSLTAISSISPTLSFYGSVERQAGLRSDWFYFLWFILVSFNLLTVNNHWLGSRLKKDQPLVAIGQSDSGCHGLDRKIGRILLAAVLSGGLAATYGILQILNIDFFIWPEPPFLTRRALSSLGQPNFLASWLLIVLPLSLYLMVKTHRWLSRIFFGFLSLIQIIGLFLTGSRGGLLAAIFTTGLFLAIYLARRWSSWRSRAKVIIAFIFCCAFVLWGLNRFSDGRVSSLLDFNYGSSGARVNFYQAAAEAIMKRPILGYGLETSALVLFRYYNIDWGVYGDVGQLADRAHNLILDTLLTTGAWGLVLSIILWYFFFCLVKENFRQPSGKDRSLSLALGLGATAYLFSLLFSFSIISGEVYFWLYLAILVAVQARQATGSEEIADLKTVSLSESDSESNRSETARKFQWFKICLILIVGFLVITQIKKPVRALLADFYFNSSYFTLSNPENVWTALKLDQYRREQKTDPVSRDFYDRLLAERLISIYPNLDDQSSRQAGRERLKEIDLSLAGNGYQNLFTKAKINHVLDDSVRAKVYLDQVIALSPAWPLSYITWGSLAESQDNQVEAIVAYQLALMNIPASDDARLNDQHRRVVNGYRYYLNNRLALIYEGQGNHQAAEKYFQYAGQNIK
ncbi:MAG: O-antigen ligase family protein [Patescibacteria group bacterium]|jgi:O-antigen ligase